MIIRSIWLCLLILISSGCESNKSFINPDDIFGVTLAAQDNWGGVDDVSASIYKNGGYPDIACVPSWSKKLRLAAAINASSPKLLADNRYKEYGSPSKGVSENYVIFLKQGPLFLQDGALIFDGHLYRTDGDLLGLVITVAGPNCLQRYSAADFKKL